MKTLTTNEVQAVSGGYTLPEFGMREIGLMTLGAAYGKYVYEPVDAAARKGLRALGDYINELGMRRVRELEVDPEGFIREGD
jgi:30S ribosomal protein S14